MDNVNIVLIDWVSIATKELDEIGVQALIGMDSVPWQTIYGCYGYKQRLYYNGVGIHFDGREDQGVLLEMSGQGCRTFEDLGHGDFEKLFETAINFDAEDITEEDDQYKVLTSPENFQKVVEGLESEGFKAESAELSRIPQNTIEVTDEKTADQILKLLDKLEEHDDVQNVYANFDIADEIIQKLEA